MGVGVGVGVVLVVGECDSPLLVVKMKKNILKRFELAHFCKEDTKNLAKRNTIEDPAHCGLPELDRAMSFIIISELTVYSESKEENKRRDLNCTINSG